jgi:hypothetical protein
MKWKNKLRKAIPQSGEADLFFQHLKERNEKEKDKKRKEKKVGVVSQHHLTGINFGEKVEKE